MRTPKIPELSAISARLNEIKLVTSLTKEEHDQLRIRRMGHLKSIAYFPTSWLVRISVGGSIFTLGWIRSTTPDASEIAARFADMAQSIFWKYRLRKRRPPTAGELNLSSARAQADLTREPDLVALLREAETLLLSKGYIKERNENEVEKRTQSKSFLAITTLDTRLDGVASILLDVQKQQGVIIQVLGKIAERLNTPPTIQIGDASGTVPLLGSIQLNK